MFNFYDLYFKDNEPVENAGFLLRLFATIVDIVFLLLYSYIIFTIGFPILSIFIFLYYPILESNSGYQGSFGKKIFRLKVVNSLGNTLTFSESIVRMFAKVLSLIPLGYGFFIIIFSKNNLSLHDKLTKTFVKVKYV